MFKNILVPIDLADAEYAKPAIANAAELTGSSGGRVRLLNVLPMTPVMLAEYVPADFDSQQRQSSDEALTIVARESGIPAARISSCVRIAMDSTPWATFVQSWSMSLAPARTEW